MREMVIGGDFDRGGDVVGVLDGIDVFGSDLSEEEWIISGSDDCIVLNINVSIL